MHNDNEGQSKIASFRKYVVKEDMWSSCKLFKWWMGLEVREIIKIANYKLREIW